VHPVGAARAIERGRLMRCARCHRSLLSKPVIVGQLGYGPTCALRMQDQLPLRPKRTHQAATQRRRNDSRQVSLLEVA
jgi:hypothetical protein